VAKLTIASGRVELDGVIETDGAVEVQKFTTVLVDGKVLQKREAIYIMLHKPAGYVSATKDSLHPTVMELIPQKWRKELHIAGRLDKETTGLLLLTNDSHWSESLTDPGKTGKVYDVTLERELSEDTAYQFKEGIYLAYEDTMTSPADLEIRGIREVRLTIYEGKYHQVKRMFHAVGNRVTSLHRVSVGRYVLPDNLEESQWQLIDPAL